MAGLTFRAATRQPVKGGVKDWYRYWSQLVGSPAGELAPVILLFWRLTERTGFPAELGKSRPLMFKKIGLR